LFVIKTAKKQIYEKSLGLGIGQNGAFGACSKCLFCPSAIDGYIGVY
jgi:hypothetical protein